MMRSDLAKLLNRFSAILFVLGLVSLPPQIALCATGRTGSQWRASKPAFRAAQGEVPAAAQDIRHVLLLSLAGAHPFDLENYIDSHPQSALAGLKAMGVWYNNAFASLPSDSIPGLIAIITGGGPATTGLWYEDGYDRALSPP
ncbi:MAG: alkaline phosphatase family protein, partial [Terriglobia bacterium]